MLARLPDRFRRPEPPAWSAANGDRPVDRVLAGPCVDADSEDFNDLIERISARTTSCSSRAKGRPACRSRPGASSQARFRRRVARLFKGMTAFSSAIRVTAQSGSPMRRASRLRIVCAGRMLASCAFAAAGCILIITDSGTGCILAAEASPP
jgi:hypothetical protein